MQYMLLVYGEERLWSELSGEESERLDRERRRWVQDLVRSGHSRGTVDLQPALAATTLRESHGSVVLCDGPFDQPREVLGGYQLVECDDLDEAISIASRFPALRAGFSLEIRPVVPL